ncbi:MAG: hypothetical protein GY835_07930 [bacterium]|nr:hypothetical protein [bacterium]
MGDYRLQPGSPAEGYGCETVALPSTAKSGAPPVTANLARDARLDVFADIEINTIWDADTVRVHADVAVEDGVTLTISAGTLVEFQDWYALSIHGRLLAVGEPQAPVRFDSAKPHAFAFDSTTVGAWAGLRFPFTRETNAASRLEYCVIEHAKNAGDSCRGGALQINGFGKLEVVNTILRENAADFGGAVACTHYANPFFAGCLITGNVAFNGGAAIHCVDAYPRFYLCTVTGNVDRNPSVYDPAVAIYAHQSKPQFHGGILRDNASLYFEPTPILYGKSRYTTYGDIGDAWPGLGVFDKDPLFVGTGDHPFSLAEGSPCIDAALPDTTGLGLPFLDLAGLPRIHNGRGDMGAYEWHDLTTVPPEVAPRIALAQNHPNPFNPSTTLRFTLVEGGPIRLVVFDTGGRLVRILGEGVFEAGEHSVRWDGRDASGRPVASGLYLARLRVDGEEQRGVKMLLTK